jgi:hypothetical protein
LAQRCREGAVHLIIPEAEGRRPEATLGFRDDGWRRMTG